MSSEGAEIRSLVHKSTDKEYIWQINESVWGSSSPVLFPAIGKIKSGKIKYKDKYYDMLKHGIIRYNQNLEFEQYTENQCAFVLNSSAKTLQKYPFHFLFKVDYTLLENRLLMTYHIRNKDEVDMYFSCGGHTAYACPLDNKTSLTDYVIEFPHDTGLKALTLGKSGLLSDRIRKIPTEYNLLELSEDIFNEDALIFADIDFDWVRLRRREEDKGVVVNFKDYPNLALWSKPGADYVCIEPWLGLPDHENESIDITKKSSYKCIQPGSDFKISIETIIE
jgi:galactose mutarotase-like enzyme